MAKNIKAGKPLMQLVGVLEGGSDPSRGPVGNPVKKRSSFTSQQIHAKGHHGKTTYSNQRLGGGAAEATATLSVDAAVDPAHTGDTLFLGDYELLEGVNWAIAVADVNTTASRIATAISNLAGFSAVVGANPNEVDITGPTGPSKVTCKIVSRTGNLSLDVTDGYMSSGKPKVSGPEIS